MEPPDIHHLHAAEGWLALGNIEEARIEFDKIRPDYHHRPEALNVSWQIQAQQKNWDACVHLAELLIEAAPDQPAGWIHRSYSLHEMKLTQAAWDKLLPAVNRFPKECIIPYNLACYACQLGHLDTAREWLEKAMKLGDAKRITAMAMTDPDLRPLWSAQ
ncbi:MAG TPA: tetratricopeptide repeat protein [Candidatus Paceibacterota bacterium]|nr:tetratricopeptide repeat protein [Verrucomicrobiota bacterium]HRY50424.1 tetratricopeptide repeat protein [Candidatus Paceibacterota bacterium]HRZ99503.1 tetratricopeptide repeat protein [Candidatus Paceibacterota bacterium]